MIEETDNMAEHKEALDRLLRAVEQRASGAPLVAVDHRVVHGGPDCDCPLVVTADVEERLRQIIPFAPLHQPNSLAGTEAVRIARPGLLQLACFDTAFHHGLPRLVKQTALPRAFYDAGVHRYGFHGLSYEYVVNALRGNGVDVDHERIIVAQLGNGASMCALKGGSSVDTTMGFSILAGLPMETRCGDLDSGVVLYLMTAMGLTLDQTPHRLCEESGLLGISGSSRNMQDLLARPAQRAAVEYYTYQVRRQLGALIASLGGFDREVFTAGTGANAAAIRTKVCTGMEYMGIGLDNKRNLAGERLDSTDDSRVAVEAFPTDEELMITGHVRNALEMRSRVTQPGHTGLDV